MTSRKTSRTKISSWVESEQTYLVSRSPIPVPLLICIELYAVLFKRTSYLEGGRVICEANIRKNNHIVIQCGKHVYLHQGVNDSERPIIMIHRLHNQRTMSMNCTF